MPKELEEVRLSIDAMATRFELLLYGDDKSQLRAIGEEALNEITILDRQLSCYRPDSEISWINAHAYLEPVKVEPRLFKLLQQACQIHNSTNGAFDITIGPLMHAWRLVYGKGHIPSREEFENARVNIGMEHLKLNEDNFTIQFDCERVGLDLGAIGKGYAIERAAELLKENEIESALLHGGTSTIYAIGSPQSEEAWRIGIKHLTHQKELRVIELRDSSLSVSAIHGKMFTLDGETYGHIIDPRSGHPSNAATLAAVLGQSPTVTDALSTAAVVLGTDIHQIINRSYTGYTGLVIESSSNGD